LQQALLVVLFIMAVVAVAVARMATLLPLQSAGTGGGGAGSGGNQNAASGIAETRVVAVVVADNSSYHQIQFTMQVQAVAV
jgi:hypothetical protein